MLWCINSRYYINGKSVAGLFWMKRVAKTNGMMFNEKIRKISSVSEWHVFM